MGEENHHSIRRRSVGIRSPNCTISIFDLVVNEAAAAKPDFGELLLQTEQAEMFVHRFELWPLGKAPTDELKQD